MRLVPTLPNALIAGLIGYIIALLISLVPNIWLLFGALTLTCAAMFLLYTVALSMINQQAKENKGIVNGLYLTFYYAGGTLGSYAPGIIYQHVGWPAFVVTLIGVTSVGLAMVAIYKSRVPNGKSEAGRRARRTRFAKIENLKSEI